MFKTFEIYHELKKPFRNNYNNFGDKVEYYRSLNIGLNQGHTGQDSVALAKDGVFHLSIFPIYSGIDGWVYKISVDSKGGWGIELITSEKRLDINDRPYFWKVRYWHMVKDSFAVKVGQKVGIGDYLGLGDNTGVSQSSHVHRDSKPGDVQSDIFIKAFPNNGHFGAVDDRPYLQTMTAYEVRTVLFQTIPELLQKIAEQVANLIKRRR